MTFTFWMNAAVSEATNLFKMGKDSQSSGGVVRGHAKLAAVCNLCGKNNPCHEGTVTGWNVQPKPKPKPKPERKPKPKPKPKPTRGDKIRTLHGRDTRGE